MTDDEIVAALVRTKKWSETEARRGLVAGFRCEYCGLDFLESAEAYRQWHCDHIVPLCSGGPPTPDNEALVCRTCNVNWKGRWDPRKEVGETATRDELVAACRCYVRTQRDRTQVEVETVRKIIAERRLAGDGAANIPLQR